MLLTFIKENIIQIITIIIILSCIITGYRKGLIHKILSVGSILITIFITINLTPIIAKNLKLYTKIENTVNNILADIFFDNDIILKLEEKLSIIEKQAILEKVQEYINTQLTDITINILAGLLVFLISIIIIKILVKTLNLVNIIPFIGKINKIMGGALCGIESLIIISEKH